MAIKKANLTRRHGKDFLDDFDGVAALEEGKTLTWIANKYGFSRQNACALFRSLFGVPYTGLMTKRVRRTADRKCRITRDPLERLKRSGGNVYLPTKAAVYRLLKARGATVEPMHHYSLADFFCNGFSVKVLVSIHPFRSSVPGKRYHRFDARPGKKGFCDVYVLYAADIKSFFVVPKHETRNVMYVPERQPDLLERGGRYYKYINQWGLLLGKRKEFKNELDNESVV
jgi:hypothetical protein